MGRRKPHTFDITFLPQCKTDPRRVGRQRGLDGKFVHLNYVIATYRHFQNSSGPFEDDSFKLLFVRLLVDACDKSEWPYAVPSLNNLIKGIVDPTQRVTYVKEKTRSAYGTFREKIERIIATGALGDATEHLRAGITKFDSALYSSIGRK